MTARAATEISKTRPRVHWWAVPWLVVALLVVTFGWWEIDVRNECARDNWENQSGYVHCTEERGRGILTPLDGPWESS